MVVSEKEDEGKSSGILDRDRQRMFQYWQFQQSYGHHCWTEYVTNIEIEENRKFINY